MLLNKKLAITNIAIAIRIILDNKMDSAKDSPSTLTLGLGKKRLT